MNLFSWGEICYFPIEDGLSPNQPFAHKEGRNDKQDVKYFIHFCRYTMDHLIVILMQLILLTKRFYSKSDFRKKKGVWPVLSYSSLPHKAFSALKFCHRMELFFNLNEWTVIPFPNQHSPCSTLQFTLWVVYLKAEGNKGRLTGTNILNITFCGTLLL